MCVSVCPRLFSHYRLRGGQERYQTLQCYANLKLRILCQCHGERVALQSSPLLSAMGPRFTLFLIVVLSTPLRNIFCVSYQPAMNQLSLFSGFHPGLPRQEFTERVYPTDSLKSLRADLFMEACDLGLVPDELHAVPLVDRRNSALRPISKVLSDDVWILVQSVSNNEYVPRTILKNGKRSHKCLQSRGSNQCPSTQQRTTQSISVPPQTIPTSQPPLMSSSATQPESSNHATFPSRSTVSDLLISRDMSEMKDEIRQLRSDISSLRNLSTANVTSDYRLEIGRELSTLRNEVTFLHEKVSSLSAHSSQEPDPLPSYSVMQQHHIRLTAWNCRGLTNAYPYLN